MADRSFLNASIPDLVNRLRVDEKISLLGAPNWWNTTAIERLHIPAIRMSDGPNGVRGSSHFCLSSQKLLTKTLDQRVTKLLTFVQKQTRRNPNIVYGDGIERSRDTSEGRQFCRNLAANGIVLLKNNSQLLPLDTCRVKRLAIIGPNAKERIISGGGSAALKAIYVVTPFDGVTAGAPEGLSVEYEVGCYAHKYLPTLEENLVTPTDEPGWLCTFYSHNEDGSLSEPVATFVLRDTRIKLNDFLPPGLTHEWTIKLEGKLTIHKSILFELGLTVAGRAKLWIDGKLTIDNWTQQTPGDFFYGQGTIEERATVDLTAGVPLDVLVEYTNTPPPDGNDENGEGRLSQPALMRGVRLGGCEKIDPEEAIQAAVSLAARSDAVLYVGGLSPEWESEGFDRPTLHMPGLQDELIHRIAEANPNTIVVIQAGSAVAMPWINSVAGLLQAWYLGNESGNAIADVLYGKINPGGRLPLTLPVRAEDIPAYLNDRSENGKIHYREDLFVGYKHYQARKIRPLFPFGFGLSYTTFSFSLLSVNDKITNGEEFALEIDVCVKNEGPMAGSEVVQVYVSYPDIGISTPRRQLKGFAKAKDVAPGENVKVSIKLNKYAVSFWDTGRNAWHASAGQYVLHFGPSSVDLPLQFAYDLRKSFSWFGL
ncbi:hypothetical protein C0992_008903 [Termitomyces sp. T32_za158]|nr:hypothetical protein C0992_008903 [Termitomyces sp. T32_za158]